MLLWNDAQLKIATVTLSLQLVLLLLSNVVVYLRILKILYL